jgi:uncharacterized cupredoxin-like copper-binding protein
MDMMNTKKIYLIMPILILSALMSSFSYAEGDLSRENVETLVLEMGANASGMYFKPKQLNLKTGQAYKLVLKNVDKIKHEFESEDFVKKIFNRKLEIKYPDGSLLAEIKGSFYEIEVGPMSEVEWFIVPIQPGENIKMVCALAGHEEAGMHGLINIL